MKLGKAWYIASAMVALTSAAPSQASRYWTLYNQEGTSGDISTIATFATFEDMVSNRNAQQAYLGNGDAGDPLFTDVHNRVATGYDGTRYWSLYNQEGTSPDISTIATFATFEDMVSNRNAQQAYLGNSDAGDPLFTNVRNRIAAGSDFFPSAVPGVPEPATWLTMALGFGAIGGARRRRRRLALRLSRRASPGRDPAPAS
jgi:hypothetical protein